MKLIHGSAVTCLAVGILVLAPSCATKHSSGDGPRPGSGIAEYRRVSTDAEKALSRALASLAAVSAQSNVCSPEVLRSFSGEIRQLQVDSLQIRARSLAMQARGDAYFERWQENMASVRDPKVRALVEAQRPALQESFHRIKSLSREGREALNPFLDELRQLRNALEKDPASLHSDRAQRWIESATGNGKHVEQCVLGIQQELDSMSARVTPPANSTNE